MKNNLGEKRLDNLVFGMFVFLYEMAVLALSSILPLLIIRTLFSLSNLFLAALAVILGLIAFILSFLCILKVMAVFVPYPREGVYDEANPKGWYVWGCNVFLSSPFIFGLLRNIFHSTFFLAGIYYAIFGLKLKPGTVLGQDVVIRDPRLLEIEGGVLIGEGSRIFCHAIEYDKLILKKVVIKKGAFIGAGSIIFPGAVIGEKAAVGAGSLVLKDTVIPDGEAWAGVPAKKILSKNA